MNIKVNKNEVLFNTNSKVNRNEVKATTLKFEFSEEYEDLIKKAVFGRIKDNEVEYFETAIIEDETFIPDVALTGEGVIIGVYAYSIEHTEEEDILTLRLSPSPKKLWLLEGSFYEGAESPEEITPSQFEQYIAYLQEQIDLMNERISNFKIESERVSDGIEVTITNVDGESNTYKVNDGEKGEKGEQGIPGLPGRDGYEQYTAGENITIEDNIISAEIEEKSKEFITITGESGTFTDEEIEKLLDDNKNVIIINDDKNYYLVEKGINYRIYLAIIPVDTTHLNYKVLYFNTSSEAVNYGTWNIEEVDPTIDLSGYYTKTETNNLLGNKQDTLTAGTNITIDENNVISASGGGGNLTNLSDSTGTGSVKSTSYSGSVGNNSFQFGSGRCNVQNGIAILGSTSSNQGVAIGYGSVSGTGGGQSVGRICESQYLGVALGNECVAKPTEGNTSVAVGYSCKINDVARSVALGAYCNANNRDSVCVGFNVDSAGNNVMGFGAHLYLGANQVGIGKASETNSNAKFIVANGDINSSGNVTTARNLLVIDSSYDTHMLGNAYVGSTTAGNKLATVNEVYGNNILLTQAEYNALTEYDDNKVYMIYE